MEIPQPQSEPVQQFDGIAMKITADRLNFGPGFAVQVSGQNELSMSQSGAFAVAAGNDMNLSFGGSLGMAVGRDQQVINGGTLVAAVGRDLSLTNGGALLVNSGATTQITNGGSLVTISPVVTSRDSFMGVVLARHVELDAGTRVLLNTQQALALGAACGAVFGLLNWLFRRR